MKHMPALWTCSVSFHCKLVVVILVLACCQCSLHRRIGLELAISEAELIRDAQRDFKNVTGRYATFDDFQQNNSGSYRPRRLEDDGYTAELQAGENMYKLLIREVNPPDSLESLSLYVDETGVIRASFDPKKMADNMSEPITPK